MWTGILRDNRAEVLSALRDARGHLEQLIEHLSQDDEQALHQFLASAKALRDQVPAQRMK
jgi:prephenate dehydrogenase